MTTSSNKTFTEFRECFYLFARSGHIKTIDELTIIMRSLGLSPTVSELNGYLKQKVNFHKIYQIFLGCINNNSTCFFFRATK